MATQYNPKEDPKMIELIQTFEELMKQPTEEEILEQMDELLLSNDQKGQELAKEIDVLREKVEAEDKKIAEMSKTWEKLQHEFNELCSARHQLANQLTALEDERRELGVELRHTANLIDQEEEDDD
jgi:chromosome segregation ATPase